MVALLPALIIYIHIFRSNGSRLLHDCTDDESTYLSAMLKDISDVFRHAQNVSAPSLVRPQSDYIFDKFFQCFGTHDFTAKLEVSNDFREAADETALTHSGRVAIFCHAESVEDLCSGRYPGPIEDTQYDWEVDSYTRPGLNLIFLVLPMADSRILHTGSSDLGMRFSALNGGSSKNIARLTMEMIKSAT